MKTKTNRFDLKGRVALITGASGLLGIEHAKALLCNNAKVILTDINSDSLDRAKNILIKAGLIESAEFVQMDVTSLDSIQGVSQQLIAKGLHVSILVNNAAIDPKVDKDVSSITEQSRLENFPLSQWDLQVSVGLTGAFLCCQVFGVLMAASDETGVIVNIASDLSVFSPDQRLYRKGGLPDDKQPVKPITYSIIKSGLIGLTRYLATYWAENGVRCNALSPGGIENNQGSEFVERLVSLIPVGRMATVDEYHSVIQFLCSDASLYMNGQNIVMDGGRSVW